MAITPVNIGRVSQNMQMNLLLSGMQKTWSICLGPRSRYRPD